MACPAITTGPQFLERLLAHLDCQAQTLGSFGFQSLAAPGSPAGLALTGLLTLFVAIYGIRLLFEAGEMPRDLVGAILKVGIILTLATSWPAWRVLAYDVVLYGPSEIANAILPSTMPAPQAELPQRLQAIDEGIAEVTFVGTGRITGEVLSADVARDFQSVALGDSIGLGFARPVFLASTIGSLGALRIAGGLLLGLAPIFAGLLLFDLARGWFVGWLRALAFVAMGSLGLTILFAVQIAIMGPWLADVLDRRSAGGVVPMAAVEALALASAFGIAAIGLLFLLARVAFHEGGPLLRPLMARLRSALPVREPAPGRQGGGGGISVQPRALALSESLSATMQRESGRAGTAEQARRIKAIGGHDAARGPAPGPDLAGFPQPGGDYRQNTRRETGSQKRRKDSGQIE